MDLVSQIKEMVEVLPVRTLRSRFEDADYLAVICHEISTPLGSIIGLSRILADTDCTPEKKIECAEMLRDSSSMLMGLMRNLLDSARLDAGMLEIDHVGFDLHKLLEGVKNIISIKAQDKALNVHLHLNSDMLAFYVGDPLRISQILLNLLSNAVKFTSRGDISIYLTEEIASKGFSAIKITVADRGIGIDDEMQKKIFNKFAQGGANITRQYGGTGLGLFISQELAHLMKGNITVKSWPHIGTHFTLALRLQKTPELLLAA